MSKKIKAKGTENILVVDIGATNTRIAIFSKGRDVPDKIIKIKTPTSNLLNSLKREISDFTDNAKFVRMSLSIAGPVKDEVGTFTNISGHPIIKGSDFNDISKNVTLINDASAAALAESNLSKTKDLIYITISSGIGVTVVKNGRIVMVEGGHLKIDSDYTMDCGCGGKNHWEAFCSGINIIRFYDLWAKSQKLKTLRLDSPADLFTRARKPHSPEREFVLNVFGKINTQAIKYLIKKYSPASVVLGGAIALNNQKLVIDGLSLSEKDKAKIRFTTMGDNACLYGALYS